MKPRKSFLRDLKIVDPSYFAVWSDEYQYWQIKKRMEILRTDKDNGVTVRLKDPTVAIFFHLNDKAITSLRRRKQIGLKYAENSLNYVRDIERQNKAARKKEKRIAERRIAEGIMFAHRMNTRKIFI